MLGGGLEGEQAARHTVRIRAAAALFPKAPPSIQLCPGNQLRVRVRDDLLELSFGLLKQVGRASAQFVSQFVIFPEPQFAQRQTQQIQQGVLGILRGEPLEALAGLADSILRQGQADNLLQRLLSPLGGEFPRGGRSLGSCFPLTMDTIYRRLAPLTDWIPDEVRDQLDLWVWWLIELVVLLLVLLLAARLLRAVLRGERFHAARLSNFLNRATCPEIGDICCHAGPPGG